MQSAVALEPRGFGERADPDPFAVFDALANSSCRSVLRAVDADTLTAAEIAGRVDAPMSSIYRHLDALTEIGFLEESVRINPRGRNQNQYTRAASEVCVSLGDDFAVRSF